MTYRQTLLASTAGMLAATALSAQDASVFDLGEIVLESYRSNAGATTIPGTVQVITGSDLTQRIAQGSSLEELLSRYVPGLSVSNGTIGGASQNLRGRNLQILINGVARTSELRGFDRELALINPDMVERVEIVKGSNAQFGNGATGGTINIITKGPSESGETTVKVRISGQDGSDSLSKETFLAHDMRVNNLGLRFELGASETGNSYDGDGNLMPSDPLVGQGSGDNATNYAFGFSADYTEGSHSFEARLDVSKFEQTPDFFSNYLTDPVSVDTSQAYFGEPTSDETQALSLRYTNTDFVLGELEIQGYATNNKRIAAFVPAGVANPLYYPVSLTNLSQSPEAQSILETYTIGVRSTVRSEIGVDGLLTWGLDVGRDSVEQTIFSGTEIIAPMKQSNTAIFAQYDKSLGARFEISTGFRHERFRLKVDDFIRPDVAQLTGFGVFPLPAVTVTGGTFDYSATVFNLGGVYHFSDTTDLFAGFSQGFSLPDVGAFTRRATGANPFASGQTVSFGDIAPSAQVVNTFEIGARHNSGALALSASAFFATSEDGTTFDSATNTLSQQKEETWGAEFTADFAASDALNVGLGASFTEGRFDSDNNGSIDAWLPNNRISAPVKVTLYGDYTFHNGLRVAGEVVYTGSRNHEGLSKVEDTTTVNLRMAKRLGIGELSLGVNNLFDQDQLNPTGSTVRRNPLTGEDVPIANAGRRIWVGYEATF